MAGPWSAVSVALSATELVLPAFLNRKGVPHALGRAVARQRRCHRREPISVNVSADMAPSRFGDRPDVAIPTMRAQRRLGVRQQRRRSSKHVNTERQGYHNNKYAQLIRINAHSDYPTQFWITVRDPMDPIV
jgi:hypothetical protein